MTSGEIYYRQYLDGDEKSFDGIVMLYYDALTLFIDGYLHDVHASEDIAVDTLLELIIHPRRYRFSSSLKTYLYTVARSRALNALKHRRFETPAGLDGTEADGQSLENDVIRDERHRALYRAMETLDGAMYEAVYLVYFEELSYEEAARVMKKNKKQIDNLLYRAREKMRAVLEKEGVKP